MKADRTRTFEVIAPSCRAPVWLIHETGTALSDPLVRRVFELSAAVQLAVRLVCPCTPSRSS